MSVSALGSSYTLLLLFNLVSWSSVLSQGSWQDGRGTMYGNDAWSIHQGSCGYGYIRPDEPLGWNVAALPDVSPYYTDSCGICFEIKCNPSSFTDGYGQYLDRTSACYDPDASLVFRITDTCPCVYPANAYSNKRWCCGDMNHFDLSVWGFERLADTKWGVIGLKFRQVPCSYLPSHQAPAAQNPIPGEQPPSGNAKQAIRDWPELDNRTAISIYNGGVDSSWQDASYNVQSGSYMGGLITGSAKCLLIQPKGAIGFQSDDKGAFDDLVAVGIYIYMGTKTAIDKGVVLTIGGSTGDCAAVDLSEVKATEFKPRCSSCADYWWKWSVYFSAFAGFGPTSIINNAKYFKGCGGMLPSDLTRLEVRNYKATSLDLCVDDVRLE